MMMFKDDSSKRHSSRNCNKENGSPLQESANWQPRQPVMHRKRLGTRGMGLMTATGPLHTSPSQLVPVKFGAPRDSPARSSEDLDVSSKAEHPHQPLTAINNIQAGTPNSPPRCGSPGKVAFKACQNMGNACRTTDFKSPGEAAAAKARNPWLQGACESPAGYDLGNNFLPQSNPLKPEFWETDIKLSQRDGPLGVCQPWEYATRGSTPTLKVCPESCVRRPGAVGVPPVTTVYAARDAGLMLPYQEPLAGACATKKMSPAFPGAAGPFAHGYNDLQTDNWQCSLSAFKSPSSPGSALVPASLHCRRAAAVADTTLPFAASAVQALLPAPGVLQALLPAADAAPTTSCPAPSPYQPLQTKQLTGRKWTASNRQEDDKWSPPEIKEAKENYCAKQQRSAIDSKPEVSNLVPAFTVAAATPHQCTPPSTAAATDGNHPAVIRDDSGIPSTLNVRSYASTVDAVSGVCVNSNVAVDRGPCQPAKLSLLESIERPRYIELGLENEIKQVPGKQLIYQQEVGQLNDGQNVLLLRCAEEPGRPHDKKQTLLIRSYVAVGSHSIKQVLAVLRRRPDSNHPQISSFEQSQLKALKPLKATNLQFQRQWTQRLRSGGVLLIEVDKSFAFAEIELEEAPSVKKQCDITDTDYLTKPPRTHWKDFDDQLRQQAADLFTAAVLRCVLSQCPQVPKGLQLFQTEAEVRSLGSCTTSVFHDVEAATGQMGRVNVKVQKAEQAGKQVDDEQLNRDEP